MENVNYRRINDFNYLSGLNLDGQMVLACLLRAFCRAIWNHFIEQSNT